MRTTLALFLVGLGFASQGCGELAKVARTTLVEPIRYPRRLDNLVDCIRNNDLAEEAWQQFQGAHEEADYSPDFAIGFKEGYADYLYAGGSGNPPPVPPRYYWRAEFESAAGHVAIQDWFAGFRAGVAVAKESGYRELVTLPLPLPPPPPTHPPAPGTPAEPEPASQVLPPPRAVPEEAKPGIPK